jgi:CheY-like chemotaxis protein
MSTIFVVDDDPMQAEVIAEVLESRGNQVQVFDDPIRAIQALGKNPADLLITDLSMPWVDGGGLSVSARQRQPGLRVLLISGYARGAEVAAREHVAFLPKPFDADSLCAAVSQALGGA